MDNVPKINEIYNYFDDGKISESRLSKVLIQEVVPIADIDKPTLELWIDEKWRCDYLYAKTTDYFIKSTLLIDETRKEASSGKMFLSDIF